MVEAGAVRARERFREIATLPDDRIDLGGAALWIAAEHYPRLDIGRYLGRLDEIATEAGSRTGGSSELDRAQRLLDFLCAEEGFGGNRDDYYDPRNSMLNEVLDRRTGIPITLSLLLLEVARRIGLDLVGVNFPGHFLVRLPAEPLILLDAFGGRVLRTDEATTLLRNALGPAAALEPEHLRAAGPREILVRMLGNLKQIYMQREEFESALACCDRILLLLPDAPLELRDRGLVYARLECFAAALADLERFLELARQPALDAAMRKTMEGLREQVRHLH